MVGEGKFVLDATYALLPWAWEYYERHLQPPSDQTFVYVDVWILYAPFNFACHASLRNTASTKMESTRRSARLQHILQQEKSMYIISPDALSAPLYRILECAGLNCGRMDLPVSQSSYQLTSRPDQDNRGSVPVKTLIFQREYNNSLQRLGLWQDQVSVRWHVGRGSQPGYSMNAAFCIIRHSRLYTNTLSWCAASWSPSTLNPPLAVWLQARGTKSSRRRPEVIMLQV